MTVRSPSHKPSYNFGIVGSTGAVGEILLEVLEEHDFPIGELRLFCSERSHGETQSFRGQSLRTRLLEEGCFRDLDFCIFSAGGEVSRLWVPRCSENGCIAIDNSSVFRMEPDVPLVVPEVNPGDLSRAGERNIVANPNCSTIQMVVALAPIRARFGLKRVIVSTYQSTSGAGRRAMDELSEQVIGLLNQRQINRQVFPHQIAFNCIPHIDSFEPNGYTREEMKIVNETRKILHDPNLAITATTVRVPTFSCHSESVYIETDEPADLEELRAVLAAAPGLAVVDDPEQALYPVPFEAAGKDEVFVGRIRRDLVNPLGLNLWIVSDNLRKGAALNALQIAEALVATVQ